MHPPPPSVFDCGQGCDRVSSARRCMSVGPSVLLPPPAPVLPTTCHISDLIYHHQLSSSLHRYHRLCCANHQHRQQQAGRQKRRSSGLTSHNTLRRTSSPPQVSRVHWRAVVQGGCAHPSTSTAFFDRSSMLVPWKTRADRPDLPCTRASSHPLSDDPSPTDTDRHVSVVNVCQYIYMSRDRATAI